MEEMDMMKMMEQAALFSKMLNPEASPQQDGLMEVMKLFMSMQQPMQQRNEAPRQAVRTPVFYDDPIQTPALRTIKAAIPYLDYPYQRNLGVMVKLIEIQKLLEMYSDRVVLMQEQSGTNWRRGMLQAIYPHVPQEKKSMLELLIKMIDIKEILERTQAQMP